MVEEAARVFFSYSHKDEALRDELAKHLSPLKRQGLISSWHDRRLIPGSEWDRVIKAELNRADIILLLVSADFIDSEYCWDIEVERAIERHEVEEAVVVPIILRPCLWRGSSTPFSNLAALPQDGMPVTGRHWQDLDEAFFNVVEGIDRLVREEVPRWRPKKGAEQEQLIESNTKTSTPSEREDTCEDQAEPPQVTRKQLKDCNPAKILYIKNVKDPQAWAYSLDRIPQPESRTFELMWRSGSHGFQTTSAGDLMILHQRAKVTHVVEFLDDEIRKTSTGAFRWVRVVWMPENDWNLLPHQKEVLGFSPNYSDGNTHSLKSPNFFRLRETWSRSGEFRLEEFQSHIFQYLTQSEVAIVDEDDLASNKGVDYTQLRDLLKSGAWKEADQETASIMIRLSGGELEGQFQLQNMNTFPCKELLKIDELWQKYSQNKFGFTVQKNILSSASRDFEGMARRVGWYTNLVWVKEQDLEYDLTAPQGHLPTLRWVEIHGWAIGSENSGYNTHTLFEKLLNCLKYADSDG